MTFRILCVTVLLSFPAMVRAQTEPVAYEEFKTLDQMRKAIARTNFEEARPILEEYFNRVEFPKGFAEELDLCFDTEPNIEKTLDTWVQENAEDYIPYAVRGYFRFRGGMDARGGGYADKISDEQWQAVGDRFDLALEDINHSLQLKPDQQLLYNCLLNIAMIESWDDGETKRILETGLRYFPDSYLLRDTYIYGLTPRWGGSYEAMQAFVEESRPAMAHNPSIRALEGEILQDKARIAWNEKDYDAAFSLLSAALEYGNDIWVMSDRAELYYYKKNYARAVEEQTRIISMSPVNANAYIWRAMALFNMDQTASALEDIRRAEHLNWNSWRLARTKGYISEELSKVGQAQCDEKNYEAAEQILSQAITFNSENKKAYYWRARVYLFQNKLEQAQSDYQEVLRIDPNHKEAAARWNEIYLRLQHEGPASVAPAN